jgi:type IV secretory system conjugative DNA transfer VirD4/TraG family protein/helicase HerA-like protein
MSSSHEATLNRETDPLALLEHPVQWLVGATVHVALGVLLGLLAARVMRHRHLHWSWAAGAFALVLLARAVLAGSAATLGVAALGAAVRGRRWHGEDLQAGADLAEIATGRTTPLDGLRSGTWAVRSWLQSGPSAGWAAALWAWWHRRWAAPRGREHREQWFRGEELAVGTDRRGRAVSIELGGASGGGTHTLVAGATGSGKTVTQTWIATQAIAHGLAAVVVDPKGDRWMREQVRRAALAAGARFIVWGPGAPAVYNPYARGAETEIADKALAGERFTEPHYQRQAQRYLGHAVRALRAAGREVSLAGLVEALDPVGLELLARDLDRSGETLASGDHPPFGQHPRFDRSRETLASGSHPRFGQQQGRAVHAYLDSLTPRQRSDLTGVRDRLAILAESDVGPWLDPATAGAERFDLLETVREGAVVYFSLQADSRPLLAQMLGSAIVQDLQTVVSALQERPARCLVVIDEFSAIAAEHVARLFARARSAGVSLLLGTQELSDLRLPGHETLLEQVLGNLTSVLAHRQAVPESAELIARLAGSRGAWRTSVSSDGRSTRTRVSEHLISPEEVMSLPRGHAAVVRLSSPSSAAIARMHSPERDR